MSGCARCGDPKHCACFHAACCACGSKEHGWCDLPHPPTDSAVEHHDQGWCDVCDLVVATRAGRQEDQR